MARPKTLTDSAICALVLKNLLEHGDRAISFRQVAAETGLAPATLVGRFGSFEKMRHAALEHGWAAAQSAFAAACQARGKGAQALLKVLVPPAPALLAASLADVALTARAESWRGAVEAELAMRLGDEEAAALAFAAWFGRHYWQGAGGRGFRLGDLMRRLG